MNKDVVTKELGRKARERLQQQKRQRAEIVRLDPDQVPAQTPPQATQPTPKKPQKRRSTAAASTKKRQRRHSTRASTSSLPPGVDVWLPNLEHLQLDNNAKRSCVVHLHGLPQETSVWHLKRFFAGLGKLRIWALLSLSSAVAEWDAQPPPTTPPPKVERHAPSHVRVLVQLDSAPNAELAAQRSGEPMELLPQPKESEKNPMVAATIGVTPCRNPTEAKYLLSSLAVELTTQPHGSNNKQPMHTQLAELERDLPPHVADILWSCAQEKLNVTIVADKQNNNGENQQDKPALEWLPLSMLHSTTILDKKQRENVAKLQRELLCHETLFPFAVVGDNDTVKLLDPTLASRSVAVRLTYRACTLLQEWMNQWDQRQLVRWRNEHLFQVCCSKN